MTTRLSIPENALTVKETEAFTALCFTTRATLRTLAQYAPGVAESLYREATRLNLAITGPIQWIYTGMNSDEANVFQLEIVLPIQLASAHADEFKYRDFSSFRCASYTYTGPWSDFGEVYNGLFTQLYQAGNQHNGQIREIYTVIDLDNPANCVTELQIGII